MAGLFDYKDVKNKPSRSGFDLSSKVCFTAKAGELLPVYWKLINPGDTFNLGVKHITRTVPVNSAAFTRIREYFDWFFVPMRLMWKSWPSFYTQMVNNPVQASSFDSSLSSHEFTPFLFLHEILRVGDIAGISYRLASSTSPTNAFGFKRANLYGKLISHLGYGRMTDDYIDGGINPPSSINVPVSLFPLAAYHKIYNDFYRFEQWEVASPYLWNFDYSQGGHINMPPDSDYWNGFTMFDLHYSNWNKDLFMGLLPKQQFGDAASISRQISVTSNAADNLTVPGTSSVDVYVGSPINGIYADSVTDGETKVNLYTETALSPGLQPLRAAIPTRVINKSALPSYTGKSPLVPIFDVIQLRQIEALQRWKEIAQAGDQDYRDQIYRHFGVSLPDELSDLCQFIGGESSSIDISEVVNQSLTTPSVGTGGSASIQGKGVGVNNSFTKRSFKEHGILMCIYHATPLLDYDISGVDPQLPLVQDTDFFIPEFDRIGLEELPKYVLSNVNYKDGEFLVPAASLPDTLGYTTRYYPYKVSYDRVLGEFRDSYSYWVSPIDMEFLQNGLTVGTVMFTGLNYNFFKVDPRVLDNIFGVACDSTTKTDQFLVNTFFDVKAVRNMDYNGLPY